ncbi:MAG TPA: hypothetical protein VF803_00325, partial [Candidatus Paceibacterota bacterium]
AIHKLVRPEHELTNLYEENRGKYKNLKEALIEDIDRFVAPMRERRALITDDVVREALTAGSEKARAITAAKMKVVRQKIGIEL